MHDLFSSTVVFRSKLDGYLGRVLFVPDNGHEAVSDWGLSEWAERVIAGSLAVSSGITPSFAIGQLTFTLD